MSPIFTVSIGTIIPHGMDHWMWEWGFSLGWLFLAFIAAFWIAVVLAIIFFIRWLIISATHKGSRSRTEDSAFEILRMRYAKGEINKEEFEQKKKDLGF